ncbi:Membrane transporter [Aphelenchoides besseyi]|nr:Membrane transporter [Aphelenchoides besseyi]KAI6199448.1 Membrane transporter [Aphelenchoides besseyi]
MTTAHRPTFDPAKGGMGRNEGDLSKLSTQYSARDMPSHKKLKYRQGAQLYEERSGKEHRRTLEDRESRSTKDRSNRLDALELPAKKPRVDEEDEEAVADGDDPLDETVENSDQSDDSEDEAELMAELAAIRKERAAEKAERESREKAEQERIRREDLLQANPLLQSDAPSNFSVKRRWDDDVVFKNCAKGTDDRNQQPTFINDSIRSQFHRRSRVLVFVLSFISYAFYHASRKNVSGVKGSLIQEWTSNTTHDPLFNNPSDASTFLGTLDALFMLFYAGALVFWGWLGDRWNPLHVVVLGMIGSGMSLVMFGSFPFYLTFYSIPYYLFFYAIFGITQAAGFPNEVTIMANWFKKNNRGFIMGMWAACQPVGNIIGAIVVAVIQPFGYEWTFIVNSVLIVSVGVVMWYSITAKPPRALIEMDSSSEEPSSSYEEDDSFHQPISMFRALTLPNVLPYCLCNACLKFTNYAFFFWLPFYLHSNFNWTESEANQLSAWYDAGGIVGSIAGGILSDRIGHRSPVITAMLVTSLGVLFLYADAGPYRILNVILMTLLGFTISGPYNLIVGTISVDLGSQPALAGNPKAMSTVTGLVDASGSAGSAIGQFFVPIVQNAFGWVYVFYLFILLNFLATLCLIRRCFLDIRDIMANDEEQPLLHQD